MNPIWIKAFPWILCLLLLLGLAGMTHLYMGERDELTKYKATVIQMGEDAKAAVLLKEKEGQDNLTQLKADHEKDIPAIAANAVAAYKLRYPANRCAVPSNGSGLKLDDGKKQELIPVGPEFIQECANDSNKVGAFIEYCSLNHCPVE